MHTLFSPVQPAALLNEHVHYKEYFPDPRLKSHIYCYWELISERTLSSPFQYQVVSDGCMDFLFDAGSSEQSTLIGLSTKSASFSLGRCFHYIGVRFLPGALPLLIRTEASELTRQDVPLHDANQSMAGYLEHVIWNKPALKQLVPELDLYFLKQSSAVNFSFDDRLHHALDTIYQANGDLRIEKELQGEISSRQLRRLFHTYIGTTPKRFSNIVRFQHALKHLTAQKKSSLFDSGFYDQAHFIKSFKTFAGCLPSVYSGL